MKRRTVLGGLGALAAAGAAGIGTGAFDTVDADRTVTLDVAPDSDAYVALDADIGTPNATYAEEQEGDDTLKIDINANSVGDGEGLGLDSEYEILQIFGLENQGTEEAEFAFVDGAAVGENDPEAVTDSDTIEEFEFLDEDGEAFDEDDPLTLDAGTAENIGVRVETVSEEQLSTLPGEDPVETITVNGDVLVKADADGFNNSSG